MAKKIRNPAGYDEIPPTDATPPPSVMLSGYYHCGYGYRVVRPRGAGSWLLFYTTGGKGLLRQPGAEFPQAPGEVALLAPDAYTDYGVPFRRGLSVAPLVTAAQASRNVRGVPLVRPLPKGDRIHRFVRCLHLDPRRPWPRSRLGWRFHWIHFQPRAGWESWLRLRETGKGLFTGEVSSKARRARIQTAFNRLHGDLLSSGSTRETLASAALEEILALAGLEAGEVRGPLDERIAAALQRIQQDPTAAHSVEALARAAALSPSRFAHLFKAQTGASVAQAVIRQRMQQARRMLAQTAGRISEIAYALGFCSPYYFSLQFKLQTGLSPKAYRLGLRKTEQAQGVGRPRRG